MSNSTYRGQTAYPRDVTKKQYDEALRNQLKKYDDYSIDKYTDKNASSTYLGHYAR